MREDVEWQWKACYNKIFITNIYTKINILHLLPEAIERCDDDFNRGKAFFRLTIEMVTSRFSTKLVDGTRRVKYSWAEKRPLIVLATRVNHDLELTSPVVTGGFPATLVGRKGVTRYPETTHRIGKFRGE